MSRYAIYSPSTGAIQRIVDCPDDWADMQAQEGEAVLACDILYVTPLTHRVEGGIFEQLPPPPPPTPEEIRALLIAAAQRHLDAYALSWGYDDLRSAVSYIGDPYPRFNAEGLALRKWRSEVWAWLDEQANEPLPDPLPTPAEFIALLPAPPARP